MSKRGFFKGVIIGGVVAGVSALLFAPKKGSELREDIMNKCEDVHKDLSEQIKKAKKSGNKESKELIEKSEKALAALNLHRERLSKSTGKAGKVANDELKVLVHHARELAAQLSDSTKKVINEGQKEYRKQVRKSEAKAKTKPTKKSTAKKSTSKK